MNRRDGTRKRIMKLQADNSEDKPPQFLLLFITTLSPSYISIFVDVIGFRATAAWHGRGEGAGGGEKIHDGTHVTRLVYILGLFEDQSFVLHNLYIYKRICKVEI